MLNHIEIKHELTKNVFIQEGAAFAILQISEFLINMVLRMS